MEPRPEEAHEKHIFQSRAVLGLQSVLRMILDGTWQSLNASEAEVITVPIWCFQRTYLAILSALELGIIDDEREKWTIYIHAVKRMLKKIEPRCKLAGIAFIYLRSLFKQPLTSYRRLSQFDRRETHSERTYFISNLMNQLKQVLPAALHRL
jgi:hypothetical protein